MRLFVGIDLSEEVRRNIDRLIAKLRPTARLNWAHSENLHITTKFIGEWPAERLDHMKAALGAVPRPGAIDIEVRGVGWFPNPHQPRVFWAGIQAGPALASLAAATDSATAGLGVERDTRRFSPHLTLARIKPPADVAALRKAVAELPSVECGAFRAAECHLYLSERGPSGSTYTKLATFPL